MVLGRTFSKSEGAVETPVKTPTGTVALVRSYALSAAARARDGSTQFTSTLKTPVEQKVEATCRFAFRMIRTVPANSPGSMANQQATRRSAALSDGRS